MATPEVTARGPEAVDGRVLRGERTRSSIVAALLALLDEGEARPTARQIAERAGVSVRSIFQHFDDLEGLYGDLVKIQATRVQPLVDALPAGGDLHSRAAGLAHQRAQLFEAITPVRRAVGTRSRQSPVLARRIRELSDVLFDQVKAHFAEELGSEELAAEELGADSQRALALALDALCSFETWERLRDHHGVDVEDAEAYLRVAIVRLLEPRTR